jgi:uncharacterized protein YkwD
MRNIYFGSNRNNLFLKVNIAALTMLFLLAFVPKKEVPILNREEARKAFMYLNAIRNNPAAYSKELKFLKSTKITTSSLIWNDTLAAVAEAKAWNMAQLNYFSHTDKKGYGINYALFKAGYPVDPLWLKPKKANYFESIAAGNHTGEQFILLLLEDKGVPSLGHRKHLLGSDEWNSTLTEIGIGYAKAPAGADYAYYCSIVIAKRGSK